MDEVKQIEEIEGSIMRIRGLLETMKNQTEEVASIMCDKYCRYPREVEDEDIMSEICDACPMNKLL